MVAEPERITDIIIEFLTAIALTAKSDHRRLQMSSHCKHNIDDLSIAMCLGNDRHALRRAKPVKASCNIRGSHRLHQQSCMMHACPGCTAVHCMTSAPT